MHSLKQNERRRFPGAAEETFMMIRCVSWREHIATAWHPKGRCVLFTCEVPLNHLMGRLSVITVNPNNPPGCQVIGMLGVNQPFPRIVREATRYGRERVGRENVFPPGEGVVLAPTVAIRHGRRSPCSS